MFKQLVIARHGETVDNARGVAQGWSDSDLSDVGREQARSLGRRLATFELTRIYCSTLARARKTAAIVSEETGLDVVELEDLREINCGEWEGVSFEAVRRNDPDGFRAWLNDPTSPCPGGESFAEVGVRVRRALETVARMEDAERENPPLPLVISHGLAIRIMASGLLGFPLGLARNLLQDNAAINIFERRFDSFVLRSWNDTSHYTMNGRHR
jgi:broad specificity phosphatase PhoE